MRSRVEPGRFEMPARVLQERDGARRRRRVRAQQAIDVVDAKTDSFHVERGNRAAERVAVLEDRRGAGVTR